MAVVIRRTRSRGELAREMGVARNSAFGIVAGLVLCAGLPVGVAALLFALASY